MSQQSLSSRSGFALKVAVLSISFVGIAHIAISPVLADIAAAYPHASAGVVQSIANAPTFVALPFILFGGAIANRVSHKKYVLIALCIFTVFGISPLLFNDITLIIVSRCLFGIGFGMLLPFDQTLIMDFFGGTKEFEPLMGFQSAVTNGGNIALQLIVGVLALVSWRNAFWVYLIGIPLILLIVFLLPEQSRDGLRSSAEAPVNETVESHVHMFRLPAVIWLYVIGTFVYGYFMVPVTTNVSFLLQDAGLGGAGTASGVLIMYGVGGLLGGVFYGFFAKAFRRRSAATGLFLQAVGMAVMLVPNVFAVFAGAFISGYAFASIMPSIMTNVGRKTPPQSVAWGFAWAIVAVNLGNFVSGVTMPYLIQATVGGTGTGYSEILLGAAGLFVAGIVAMIFSVRKPSDVKTVQG